MIPKIIHYCWLSKDPLPNDIKACIYSWKRYLPDYEIKLWNFSCFDIESSRWVKEAFLSGKYAFAADYIRIYALYNYGGIYLDSDVEVLKSFDDFLHLPYFIGQERCEQSIAIEAATIGFEKGHPLLASLLNYYEGRNFILENNKFDTRTLPSIFLECVYQNYRLKEVEGIDEFDFDKKVISIFPSDYFSPKKWDTKELDLTSNTYSIHHFAGSWKKKSLAGRVCVLRYRLMGLFMSKYRL